MTIYNLQDRANIEDDGSGDERPSSPEARGDGKDEKAAEEGTAL